MTSEKIIFDILDQASEDACGSWDLYWGVKTNAGGKESSKLRRQFVEAIKKLVDEGKLKVLQYKPLDGLKNKTYINSKFNSEKLKLEVEHNRSPDPNTYYWFETTKLGNMEYKKLYEKLKK